MHKKGVLPTRIVLYVAYLVIAIIILTAFLIYINNAAGGTNFNKRYLARDLALLIDALYLSPGNVLVVYDLGDSSYVIEISENVRVRGLKDTFFKYDFASDLFSYKLNYLIGSPFGVNKIKFLKDSGGISVIEIQKVLTKLSSKDKELISKIKPTFIWPFDNNMITSCFGSRDSGFSSGVDISACESKKEQCADYQKPVKAVADGLVTAILFGENQNNVVRVFHLDGVESSYSYLSSSNVKAGDKVKKGQVIGISGKHRINQPYLHMEIKIGGNLVDPLLFFDTSVLKYSKESNCNYNKQNYAYSKDIEDNIA